MKKKPTCPRCRIIFFSHNEPLSMVRLYIKEEGRWKAIGWICKNCGYIILDKIPIKKYYYVEPVLKEKTNVELEPRVMESK